MNLVQLVAYSLLSFLILIPAMRFGWEGFLLGTILLLLLGAPLRDLIGLPLRWVIPAEPSCRLGRFESAVLFIQPLLWRYPGGFEPTIHEATAWHLRRDLRVWLQNPLDIGRMWVVWRGSDGQPHVFETVWPHLFIVRWRESSEKVREYLAVAVRHGFLRSKERNE